MPHPEMPHPTDRITWNEITWRSSLISPTVRPQRGSTARPADVDSTATNDTHLFHVTPRLKDEAKTGALTLGMDATVDVVGLRAYVDDYYNYRSGSNGGGGVGERDLKRK